MTHTTQPLTTDLTPASRAMTLAARATVQRHGNVDWSRLTYACTDCGSIGESADRDARDAHVRTLDLACCSAESTVVFMTVEV